MLFNKKQVNNKKSKHNFQVLKHIYLLLTIFVSNKYMLQIWLEFVLKAVCGQVLIFPKKYFCLKKNDFIFCCLTTLLAHENGPICKEISKPVPTPNI
jgi:hypothetical protein